MIRKYKYFALIAFALLIIAASVSWLFFFRPHAFVADAENPGVYIRANQVGYRQTWSKEALVLSRGDLKGRSFMLYDSRGNTVYTGKVGVDRGSWGDAGDKFPHVYVLDFSSFQKLGKGYTIGVSGQKSLPFDISANPYVTLASLSLEFFKVNRCGDTDPTGHEACHLTDGKVVSGPTMNDILDVTGGWHDAADYIKFMVPTSYTTDILLASYLHHPDSFVNPEAGVLAEAKIGLDFMSKMWDDRNQVLYMSVADATEHGRFDVWPEDDDFFQGPRPVYPCPKGTGANIAGKAAAAFALASKIWGNPKGPCYDAELAKSYLTAAEQLYDFGKNNPAVAADKDGGYEESEWKDDMALGAAELFRATSKLSYLDEAKAYADTLGVNSDGEWPTENLSWSREYHWANYEIAKLDTAYALTAAARMENHLNSAWWYADGSPFYLGVDELRWSSNAMLSQLAVEACMYKDLTDKSTYMPLAQREFNYLLGSNPWGVSFLNSAGTNWWVNPRHRVDYLNKQKEAGWNLVGSWNEGATSIAVHNEYQNDSMDPGQPDKYAAFQDTRAVWYDNRMDFVTNEPCLNANAAGLAVSVWFDAATEGNPDEIIPTPPPKPSPSPTATPIPGVYTYAAAEDSFVRSGVDEDGVDHTGQNFGTSTEIQIKDDVPENGYMRQGYIKFNAEGLADVTVAKLRLYGSGADATVKVFSVEDDSWLEKEITYNNKPGLSAEPLDTQTVTSEAQYYEFDVTGFIQSEISRGQSVFSFAVTGNALQDRNIVFNSKENGTDRPQLVITTKLSEK